MARGNLYGALVLVVGGMVAVAALVNQPQPAPSVLPTVIIPTVVIPTGILPTVILPTVQVGPSATIPSVVIQIPATAVPTQPPTVAAQLVMPAPTGLGRETTAYGDVLPFNPEQTYYAGVNGAKLRSCPNRTCEVVVSLLAGEKFIADGAIDGEEVNAGNKLWYRTRVSDQVLYGYSGIMDMSAPSGTSGSQPTQPIVTGGTCPNISMTCGQMTSCEQARSCLAAGNTSLDSDSDGIPCESLCGG